MNVEKSYNEMSMLLSSIEPSQAWIDEFNDLAINLEQRDEMMEYVDDVVPTTSHVIPWKAILKSNKVYLVSPPITKDFVSFHLILDALHPLENGSMYSHINARVVQFQNTFDFDSRKSFVNCCLIVNSEATVVDIFAVWDFVAREGIETSVNSGIIEQSWINVLLARMPCEAIPPEHLQRSMDLFDAFRYEKNIEKAVVEYVRVYLSNHVSSKKFLRKYRKFEWYARSTGLIATVLPWSFEKVSFEVFKRYTANMNEKEFRKFICRPGNFDLDTYQKIFQKAEKEIYPDEYERIKASETRERHLDKIVSSPDGYYSLLWSLNLFKVFSDDRRTANYKSKPKNATHYYVVHSWDEHGNVGNYRYDFYHARAIIRYEDGSFKTGVHIRL